MDLLEADYLFEESIVAFVEAADDCLSLFVAVTELLIVGRVKEAELLTTRLHCVSETVEHFICRLKVLLLILLTFNNDERRNMLISRIE